MKLEQIDNETKVSFAIMFGSVLTEHQCIDDLMFMSSGLILS